MKKGDKKGQFYLIAAMIMIIIITLFAVIFNFSEKSDVSKLKELGEQLSIESEKVLDYDTYNGENEIETFTQEFSSYAGSDVKIYYITGRKGDIGAYKYVDDEKIIIPVDEIGEEIHLTLDGIDHKFDIQPGENFYYVLSQDINGETHVVINR